MALLERVKPDAVYVTHPQDIHPDHWATCAFVSYGLAALAAESGNSWAGQTRLYGYLIHWPRFPSPRRLRPKLPLNPPSDIVTSRSGWVQLPLSPDDAKRKLSATRMYRSQLPSLDRLLLDFVRANELFALLPVRGVQATDTLVWVDDSSRRRNLHGADVAEVTLEIRADSRIRAELTRAPNKLGKGAYVSLDLRSWDTSGRPVIENITIARGAEPKGVSIAAGEVKNIRVAVRELGSGRVAINGLRMPRETRRPGAGAVVTCWGSVRDKVTDPTVVARVESVPTVTH
jgi:hypothetical protein